MKHLLNCRACEWYAYVDGCSALADVERDSHEQSLRNMWSEDACPSGSVAWVTLPVEAREHGGGDE